MTGEPGDPVGSRIRPEVGIERTVLLHDDHDVTDLVDPVSVGGASLVRVPRKFRRGEQEPAQRNDREKDERDPLQRGRSLRSVLES
jgi:hypothetical protein